jgi:hypothetical protein
MAFSRGMSMADQQAQSGNNSGRNFIVGVVLACYLIGSFVWNVLTEAHEYPMRTEQVLTMSLNLLGVIGLIGMRAEMPKPVFWCALIAGIGLFALRLAGDDGWWTGHLSYSLPPR